MVTNIPHPYNYNHLEISVRWYTNINSYPDIGIQEYSIARWAQIEETLRYEYHIDDIRIIRPLAEIEYILAQNDGCGSTDTK